MTTHVPHDKSIMWHTTVYICTIAVAVDAVAVDAVLCHTMHDMRWFHVSQDTYYYINNYIANASCTKMSIFAVKYTKLHTAAFL